MSEGRNIFTSAANAVKDAKRRAARFYVATAAVAGGLYLTAQNIAEQYVPGGVWNSEAYGQSWGADGVYATLSLGGAILSGLVLALGVPITFSGISRDKDIVTEIDRDLKRIKQTKGDGTVSKTIDYDAILSIGVNQTRRESRKGIGSLEIGTVSVEGYKEDYGNSRIVEDYIEIPFQEQPHLVREHLLSTDFLPGTSTIKKNLRSS